LLRFALGAVFQVGFILSLLVGSFIGCIAGFFTKKGESMGILANVFAGLVGSCAGYSVFGLWVSKFSDFVLIPSVVGAVVLIALLWLFTEKNW
jgi:transglycosylase associated protein